jgi:hypothetical protein
MMNRLEEISKILEELSSDRNLNNKYGPAVLQAAVIAELHRTQGLLQGVYGALHKLISLQENKKPGPAAKRAARRKKRLAEPEDSRDWEAFFDTKEKP